MIENIILNDNCKLMQFFGCCIYDSNPPLHYRILKRLGIYYGINRYFINRTSKIYPKYFFYLKISYKNN